MRRVAAALVTAALAAGCAGGEADDASTVADAAATTTASAPRRSSTSSPSAATSTSSPTSTSMATTIAPPTTTTSPPTTTPVTSLRVPIEPPPDDGGSEPRVEVGSIEIARLGLVRTMLEGIRMATLDLGPGHWPGTALPGDLGNVVVAGHRVSHNADFRDLDELAPGDEVVFNTLSGRHVYRVVRTEIVGPEAVWIVSQTVDHTGTLFACHPPGSTRQRIVVHLELSA